MQKKYIVISAATALLLFLSICFTVPVSAFQEPDANYWSNGTISLARNGAYGQGMSVNGSFRFQHEYKYSVSFSPYSDKYFYNGYIRLMLPLTITMTNAHVGNVELEFVKVQGFEPVVLSYTSNEYFAADYWNGSVSFYVDMLIPFEGMLQKQAYDLDIQISWFGNYSVNSPNSPTWSYNWSGYNSNWSLKYTENPVDTLQDIKNRIGGLTTGNADSHAAAAALDQASSDYSNANAAADSAVDAAVPNYDNDLATVNNADTSSFFTNQSLSVLFWRDVGEFLLDSREIGFVASGLIIVTIITLFVYLLRL